MATTKGKTSTLKGSIRRRGDKHVLISYVDGKHHWQTFPDRESAELAQLAAQTARITNSYVTPSAETMGQYMRRWLAAHRGSVKSATAENYSQMIEKHIVPGIGRLKVSQLKVSDLNAWYVRLAESGRLSGKGGLGSRSIRLAHTIVHKALSDATRQGELSRNVAAMATLPRMAASGSAMRVWTGDQLRQFLDHPTVQGDRLFAAFALAGLTGLRRGEVCGLRWSDVDLDRAALSVSQALTLTRYRIVFGSPKTASSRRRIALDPYTVQVLRDHRSRQLQERLALGLGKEPEGALVFVDALGGPVNPQHLADHFAVLAKAAGLPVIRFHDLRHTHATLGLSSGVPAKVMQERLGHSNVALTLAVYSHTTVGMDEQAAATIAASVFGVR